jgi:hypothetical protein
MTADRDAYLRRIDRGDSAPIYVTSSGAEFVRASEVLSSEKGQAVLRAMADLRLRLRDRERREVDRKRRGKK